MRFDWTLDLWLVHDVLTSPTQARMSMDDATDIRTWQPSADPRVMYVRADASTSRVASKDLAGIFTFAPQNAVCYEIHAAILPRFWGAKSREALRGALEFFWHNTGNMNDGAGIPRIVCGIPQYNKLAVRLAKDCGFHAFGRNRQSFLRHGALHDQILLGISRGKVAA